MAFPERALSEPRAIDSLLKEGWLWRSTGGMALHLVPPHPGRWSRTLCGLPLSAEVEQLGLLGGAECGRCIRSAGL
jgi:hypothetical protein